MGPCSLSTLLVLGFSDLLEHGVHTEREVSNVCESIGGRRHSIFFFLLDCRFSGDTSTIVMG